MESLVFSLNATVPIFLMMVLGYFFRQIGVIDEEFASKMNTFVFMVPLPALVFEDVATIAIDEIWNLKFILFCLVITILGILIVTIISMFWKDRSVRGEFIQASYRSSAALLGFAFIENIYGDVKLAPLMILGCVPVYNVMAVLVLSLFKSEQYTSKKELMSKTVKGIITNPIILAVVIGFLWSALKIPMPQILGKTVSSFGAIASPLGLMAMGASFSLEKAFAKLKPALTATFIKLIGLVAIFLPLAIQLGFREEELVAVLVMLGSATTVSCYVMAKNMGHEGSLSSSVIMLTTLFSAFTFTMWLFILRSFGLI